MRGCYLSSLMLVVLMTQLAPAQPPLPPRLAEEIDQEATRPNHGDAGRPLPLAAHWNVTGMYNEGFTPAYQRQLLQQGHHLLPWLQWPPTDRDLETIFKQGDPRKQKYIDERMREYEKAVKELARLHLPLSFLATQWESLLTYDRAYFDLPAEQNPNVVGRDGKIQRRVCPMGPLEPWRQVGRSWTDNTFMKRLQEWYPDPPLVLFVSNNEHARLTWDEVEQSKRYLDRYGAGKSGEFKRKVVGDGWIERYGAMLASMKAGLSNKHWQEHVKFIGYEAFPPVHFGRWGGWKQYSLTVPGRLDPQPLVWDGGSPSYYLHNWMAITDYTLWSPQVETMNWVFMLDEIHKTRPDFWFELSTWDGDQPGAGNDKRKFYARLGQPYSPDRYEGMVQYGMWLTRPRSVREFRGHTEAVEYAGPYFQAILAAVDRVWREPTLRKFWRHGTLVPNPRGRHPYQADIPPEYKDAGRWFLLDTSLTPRELAPTEFDNAKPPSRQVEIPVFALALVLGTAPEREWLVFAHAPQRTQLNVAVTVPGLGPIHVDVPQSGSFFHVKEKGQQVQAAVKGGPASFRFEAPRFVEVGAEQGFAVTEKYSPTGTIDAIKWDLGRTQAAGDQVRHRFPHSGQYLVTVTGWQDGKEVARAQAAVFAGLKPEPGLVCRLLMKGTLEQGMKSWIWYSGWDKVDYHFIPDASGSGNMGFLAGGTWVKDAHRGTVLELNGQRDRVEISNSPALNTGSAYANRTLAFWYRAARLDKKDKKAVLRQVLFEEGGSGSGLNLYLDGDVLYAGTWAKPKGAWLHTADLERAAWRHLAFVLRGTAKTDADVQLELYLDGVKVADGKGPMLGPHPGDINLGRNGSTLFHDAKAVDHPSHYFAGRVDDFRIVNRALSEDEIRALARPR